MWFNGGMRQTQVVQLWNTGRLSMADIGRKLSLSRERIRQIIESAILGGIGVLSATQWEEKRRKARSTAIELSKASMKWEITGYKVYRSEKVREKFKRLNLIIRCEWCHWDEFNWLLKIHHPDNLIILCPICHDLIHYTDFTTNKNGKRKTGINSRENSYKKAHRYKRKNVTCQ
jgi:hypothetical protein